MGTDHRNALASIDGELDAAKAKEMFDGALGGRSSWASGRLAAQAAARLASARAQGQLITPGCQGAPGKSRAPRHHRTQACACIPSLPTGPPPATLRTHPADHLHLRAVLAQGRLCGARTGRGGVREPAGKAAGWRRRRQKGAVLARRAGEARLLASASSHCSAPRLASPPSPQIKTMYVDGKERMPDCDSHSASSAYKRLLSDVRARAGDSCAIKIPTSTADAADDGSGSDSDS